MTCGSPIAREINRPHRAAQYPGKCPDCGNEIEEGDPIYLVDGDWLDEECAQLLSDPSDPGEEG